VVLPERPIQAGVVEALLSPVGLVEMAARVL